VQRDQLRHEARPNLRTPLILHFYDRSFPQLTINWDGCANADAGVLDSRDLRYISQAEAASAAINPTLSHPRGYSRNL
jgi:hypothetical protein